MHSGLRLSLVLLFATAARAGAQTPPSPEDVLGHALGERFTDAARVVQYAEALEAASDRVRLIRYGTTAEGRPLLLLVVASVRNQSQLLSQLHERAARRPMAHDARDVPLSRHVF